MPLGLDPTRRVPVYLPSDEREFPDVAARPVFYAHFMTCTEHFEYEDLLKEARDAKASKVENAKLNDALAVALIGWANMFHVPRGKTKPEALSFDKVHFDKLTPLEKWKLAYAILGRISVEESELGKSNSQRTSDGASTAVSAVADAPTSPAPSAQS